LATTGAGGVGGAILNLHYELSLLPATAVLEKAYSTTLTAGYGGDSVGGIGGAGGAITGTNLNINPSYTTDASLIDAGIDNTALIALAAGHGGQGASGGNGGTIQSLTYVSDFSQVTVGTNEVVVDPVALSLIAGYGGKGTNGNGGNGGSVILSAPIQGVSYYDNGPASPDGYSGPPLFLSPPDNQPNQSSVTENPLIVTAGKGGDGSVKGGVGGSISGIVSENARFSDGENISHEQLYGATLTAGNGGNGGTSNGGAGGSITGSSIGFQNNELIVMAGTGGNGGAATGALASAVGGAGGSIKSSVFGLVGTDDQVGIVIFAGSGGSGIAAGGAGGSIVGMTINTPEGTAPGTGIAVPSAVIYAGDGGDADSASGAGGSGGSISGITQLKDVNSSIDVVQAGNGGDNMLGRGGVGGNVSSIHSVGFIGRPTDGVNSLGVFDFIGTEQIAQGIFSGRGGASASGHAANGSVSNIVARQIAAISAAEDTNTGLFAAASKISQITADVIGFDVYRDTTNPDAGTYTDGKGGHTDPGVTTPLDGFMWSLTAATGIHVAFPEPTFVFTGPT
jgi:hypothetical protein